MLVSWSWEQASQTIFSRLAVDSVAYRDIESARNHQNNVKPDANLKKFHCDIYEYPYHVTHNHEVIKMQANDIRGLKLLSQQTYN